MTTPRAITLVNLVVLIAICVNSEIGSAASAVSPTVSTALPPKEPQRIITGNQQENETGAQSKGLVEPVAASVVDSASALQAEPARQPAAAAASSVSTAATGRADVKRAHANNAEKVKRGLTNFMSHLNNPATYFVPPKEAVAAAATVLTDKPAASSQVEPATIVNQGTSADVVIKGPNRLVQTRQWGAPMRWGRR